MSVVVQNLSDFNSSAVGSEGLRWSPSSLPFYTIYLYAMDSVVGFHLPIAVFGIVANIFNIVVFVKTGVKDNMTVSFLALSVSDLMYLVLLTPHLVLTVLAQIVIFRLGITINWLFEPRVIRFPFYWYAFTFYETSILINVYISVVRCACVAMPFKVKNTFTARRAYVAFTAFFILIFLSRFPMYLKKRIVSEFDPVTNKTRVVYREFDDGGLAEKLNDIWSRNILNWVSFVIIITCVIILITKLRASARFRSSTATSNTTSQTAAVTTSSEESTGASTTCRSPREPSFCASDVNHNQKANKGANDSARKSKSSKEIALATEKGQGQMLSVREAQAVRSVILVAVVFITCQAPLMAYTLARRFESQFDDTDDLTKRNLQKYIFLFGFCSNLTMAFAIINSSVNILIYYNFNSRYRQAMKSLWTFKNSVKK